MTDVTDVAVQSRSALPADRHSLLVRKGHGPEGRRFTRTERWGLVFILPFFVMFLFFLVIPIIYALYDSFFTTRLIGGTAFTGFSNYKTALESGAFWRGMLRTAIYAAIQVPVLIAIATFFATLFDLGVAKWGAVFRTIFFIPFAVPTVVAGVMWSFLFEDPYGPLDRILHDIGLGHFNFMGAGAPLLGSIIVIATWEWTGYTMVILFTALRSVPRDVVESAVIDGARLGRVITRVKLPMIAPAITLVGILNIIGALQLFVEPEVLTVFTTNVSYNYTPTIYLYNQAYAAQEYNLAAAISFVLALIIIVISVSFVMVRRRKGGWI
jgi:multiple sugar transport system permease protein